ncbi:DoxX family protein [Candidatus Omnitrophota bacterium]
MKDWAAIPLRLGLGAMFVGHGLQKAFGLFNGPGIEGFKGFMVNLGLPFPTIMAYAAAYVELVGGLFLILGLLTKLSATALLGVMLVAMLKVHFENGFFLMNGGYEYTLIIIVALISLIFSGPGKFCVNRKL